jgi:hypothetical protein
VKYADGTEVREGDEVLIDRAGGQLPGVVVKVLAPETDEALAWSSPNGGVVIKGGGIGLSVTESIENDREVVFVRRGTPD